MHYEDRSLVLFDCDNHSTPVTTMSLLGLFSFSFRNPVSAFRNFPVGRDSVEPLPSVLYPLPSVLYLPSSVFRPPSSGLSSLGDLLDRLPVFFRKLNFRRRDIFLQVRDRRRAGDRQHHRRSVQQPRQRELHDARVMTFHFR